VFVRIGERQIGNNNPVFIIAEAGVNHNGDIKFAKKIIDAAKKSGASAIKFQTFKASNLVTKTAPKAKYQKIKKSNKSQFDMLKDLELSDSDFRELFVYCQKKKIIFLSTPFDQQSAGFLYDLGVSAFKISSGDLTDIPLLQKIAGFKKPIILSTGMSTLAEVKEAVKAIYVINNRQLILLHCTSNYPTKFRDVNLKAILTLRKEFNLPIGYSDHTEGVEIPIAAIAMGACIIEKHLTLDKNLLGPDHKASLNPEEFSEMVDSIRIIEMAMGNGIKNPTKSEIEMRKVARKSIVTVRDISKGERITRDMLAVKRPGTGIPPKLLTLLIGKYANRMIKKDNVLNWGLIS